MKNKLKKNDVLWIFAVKEDRVKKYYEKNYGIYNDQPNLETLYFIFSQIIDKVDDWRQFHNLLRTDRTMHRLLRKMKKQEELKRTVSYEEIEPTFEEWMWIGFQALCNHVTIYMFDTWCGNRDWEKWIKDERNMWEKIENGEEKWIKDERNMWEKIENGEKKC